MSIVALLKDTEFIITRKRYCDYTLLVSRLMSQGNVLAHIRAAEG